MQATKPLCVDLRVRGELGEDWASWFTDGQRVSSLVITVTEGVTTLTGTVADQSALYCLLNRICDLGLVLLSVSHVEAAPGSV